MEHQTNPKPPLGHRLKRTFGKFFGYHFVPENHVRVIYRDEKYYDARGDGFIHIDGFFERADILVDVASHFDTLDVDGLPTNQGVPIGLRVYLGYRFDPRDTIPEIAVQLINLKRETFFALTLRYIREALLQIVPGLNVEEIARGQALLEIQRRVVEMATPRLSRLGITLSAGLAIQKVILPPELEQRLIRDAQHGLIVSSLHEHQPEQNAQALAAQVLEKLNLTSAEYVNMPDAFAAFKTGTPTTRPTHTIGGKATPLNPPPAADPPNPPQAAQPVSLPAPSKRKKRYTDSDTW